MIAKPTPRPKVRKPLKSRPHAINPSLKERVLERDDYTCRWCGVHGGRLDAHHVLRRSQGGKDTLDNLVSLHRLCHNAIHDHPKEASRRGFLRSPYLADRPIPEGDGPDGAPE